MGQEIVEVTRFLADKVREHLALAAALEIRAGRWCREIELRRVARVLGHVVPKAFRSGTTSRLRFSAKSSAKHRALPQKRQSV